MQSWKRIKEAGASMAFFMAGGVGFAQLEISRSTIDGGGVMRTTGGTYELSGTIGQPDAGEANGGSFALTGGFWFGTPPGDGDEDGVTGLLDMQSFKECLLGPAGPAPSAQCRSFDVDGSGRIDLEDFAALQKAFGGP